ncbi:MAG: transcriptional regulator [Deltaproteobacteria bacterium]|nr:transcriptional regulator [Deltaproteobacteria bacterium]
MRLIAYIILIFLLYKIIKHYLSSEKRIKNTYSNDTQIGGEEMILDEICQTYFPKGSALRVKNRGIVHYFCSEGCREKYLTSHRS